MRRLPIRARGDTVSPLSRALVLLTALCVSSCIHVRLVHNTRHAEPRADGLLHAGSSDLSECLDELGAPLLVREHVGGALLAWGWADDRAFGVTLAVPVARAYRANLSYARSFEGLRGLVLFFDEDWTLEQLRRGYLAEILPDERTRPALIE